MSVPIANDLQSYMLARDGLIVEDRALRRDTGLVQNATEEERRAEQIIREIRSEEAQTIWSVEHEGITNIFPGMEFLSGRSICS